MLTAMRRDEVVNAHQICKADGPFFCPECESEVILKKGIVLTHHFAHKSPANCYYGVGESEIHRSAKISIFEALSMSSKVSLAVMEKSFDSVRADIFAVINDVPVAIEIQRSNLTTDDIVRRTIEYAKKNIYVLWLAIDDGRIDESRFIPKWWEKWIHAAYFGQVFYWHDHEFIIQVSFGAATTYVEATGWGGGYQKTLKRYKTPIIKETLSIIDDFVPMQSQSWSSQHFYIPARKIYTAKKEFI